MAKDFVLKKFTTNRLRLKADKDQLIAAGAKQAEKVTAADLGEFEVGYRDSVKMIKAQEDSMIPELLPLRHQRMMKNAFTFFRGTAGIMEYDLMHGKLSGIPVMTCGDAHLNNFGFFASPERQLLFGLNDFDEARVGNWEADLKRLLVSIQLTSEINDYQKKEQKKTLEEAVKAYKDGIDYSSSLKLLDRFYLAYNVNDLMEFVGEHDEAMIKVLKKIAKQAPKNNSAKVVKKFTTVKNGQRVFKENPPRARSVTQKQYEDLLKAFDGYRKNLEPNMLVFLSNFQVSDIIRYSVGVGSFGTRCYLVLLTGKDGSHLVLQIKEALPSKYDLNTLSNSQALQQGYEEGRRVITGQKILQTFYDPFLGYTEAEGRSYYVRQFRDMKDSIDPTKLDYDAFVAYCRLCSFILAVAHFQSPTAPMIVGYLNKAKKFTKNMIKWTDAYAEQVHQDYKAFEKYLRGE